MIGEAMGHKRKPGMLIATKARFPMGEGPNDAASPAGTSFANSKRA